MLRDVSNLVKVKLCENTFRICLKAGSVGQPVGQNAENSQRLGLLGTLDLNEVKVPQVFVSKQETYKQENP
jgi:hypothetical protein